MTTQPGWYADPTGRYEHRYWDGQRWTERVGAHGQQLVDATPAQPLVSEPEPASVAATPSGATEKITAFNAKGIANRLQVENLALSSENARLLTLLEDLGALEAAEREARIARQREVETDLKNAVERLDAEKARLDSALIVTRDRLALEEFGLFDFEHPAEASAALATELEALRSQIRQTNKIGNAITATSNFTFNNSASKGRTFVNQMSRIMLRAYNAEAENAVKTVKAGSLAPLCD